MDIIIKEFMDQTLDNAYSLGHCDWANKSISDIVLIEFQCRMNEDFIASSIDYCLQLKQEYGRLPKYFDLTFAAILLMSPTCTDWGKKRVDQTFMVRLITYSINVFMRYKFYPIVLTFCVDTASQAVIQTFEQSNIKANMFETICYNRAKNCYLLSNKIIEPALTNESSASMDPIIAIQYFFGSQQRNIMALDLYDNVAIIELYRIAKNETEKHVGASKSQLDAF